MKRPTKKQEEKAETKRSDEEKQLRMLDRVLRKQLPNHTWVIVMCEENTVGKKGAMCLTLSNAASVHDAQHLLVAGYSCYEDGPNKLPMEN